MSDHQLVSEQRLEAEVQQEGQGVFIEVPAEVMAKLSPRKRPPVLVTLNGYTYRSTSAVYVGRYYLGPRHEVREAAGVRVNYEAHWERLEALRAYLEDFWVRPIAILREAAGQQHRPATGRP
jgi:hypothetical protein